MRIAVAQFNPTVGDLAGNAKKILEAAEIATQDDVDMVVFGAHALTGWPLAGLALSQAFLDDVQTTLQSIAKDAAANILISAPKAVQICDGVIEPLEELFVIDKKTLNSLGVPAVADPDESFGVDFGCDGVSICLDGHFDEPVAEEGDTVLLEMCADAFDSHYALPAARGKLERLKELATQSGRFAVYVNLAGAADDVVFAGGSVIVTPQGELLHACSLSKPEIVTFDTKPQGDVELANEQDALQDEQALMWEALTLATHDYVVKNGFDDVVIGLSGGIDSSVVAALAADALGAKNVHGVLMPSKFSSAGSVDDAAALAANLGIDTVTIPISGPADAFSDALAQACGGKLEGVAAENLQARVRCVYLMTLSNAHGWMLLNTGNKSEAAMGFSTLYGDTAGAYAPIGELYKTQVYELARWRAAQGASIPQACIDKAPSAELYEGAKDSDRLPEYDVLDRVLAAHIEGDAGRAQLLEEGFDQDVVDQVLRGVRSSEYKRRVEPVAPRLGGVALTSQRAWPITNGWCDR